MQLFKPSRHTRPIIIITSFFISVCMVIISANVANVRKQRQIAPAAPTEAAQRVVSMAEIEAADGKEGRDCLVGIDGVVYKISDSALWQDGQHSPSGGEAYCGADLSEALKHSPHGKSKLEQLDKIGTIK
jgi:predicted heme/steroid binding protein